MPDCVQTPVRHEVALTCPNCGHGVLKWHLTDDLVLIGCWNCASVFRYPSISDWNALSKEERMR